LEGVLHHSGTSRNALKERHRHSIQRAGQLGEAMMKKTILFALLFATFGTVQAREKFYEKGQLLQMEAVQCGFAEKDGKTFKGEILGTNGEHKNTEELLCQEYVLQSDTVIYRIRPKDAKHPVLLRIGEEAQFRIEKDKMLLRLPESNDKEREYSVVSMTPRADAVNAKASARTSGH
jgi:hypothetical protein